MLSDTPSRQVQSVKTAFTIINELQNRGSATPTQLSDRLDLSNSSIHNYLSTLEHEGYVVNEGGRYRLGLRFLTHGIAAKNTLRIQNVVREALQSIATEFSYLTWWVAEEFGRGLFLDGVVPEDQTATYGIVGKRSYLHTHALGKAILAESSDNYVEQVIERYGLPEQTMRTTTDIDTLFEELHEIRDRGFEVSDGEAVLGINSLGAGFKDTKNRIHAIGVFGNSRDLAGTQAEEMGSQLRNTADALAHRLQEMGIDGQ